MHSNTIHVISWKSEHLPVVFHFNLLLDSGKMLCHDLYCLLSYKLCVLCISSSYYIIVYQLCSTTAIELFVCYMLVDSIISIVCWLVGQILRKTEQLLQQAFPEHLKHSFHVCAQCGTGPAGAAAAFAALRLVACTAWTPCNWAGSATVSIAVLTDWMMTWNWDPGLDCYNWIIQSLFLELHCSVDLSLYHLYSF